MANKNQIGTGAGVSLIIAGTDLGIHCTRGEE